MIIAQYYRHTIYFIPVYENKSWYDTRTRKSSIDCKQQWQDHLGISLAADKICYNLSLYFGLMKFFPVRDEKRRGTASQT